MSTTAHEPSSNAAHVVSSPTAENSDLSRQNPNSNFPPSTDKGDVGAIWYSYSLAHKRITAGGWTHQVTQRELPTSKDLAGVNMRLAAGAYRELHWHSADEWAYMLYGNARLSVMQPDGTMYINGSVATFPIERKNSRCREFAENAAPDFEVLKHPRLVRNRSFYA